ncbi:MAG: tetratricopeptide repeat protein [Deltaproteobacteria bacterium]|nr:tetratricopeptide repeat protein [Deltaproteobacteria bacterium]
MSQAAADALVEEGNDLFRKEQFVEAAARYERAGTIFPQHAVAWKGLGHALLCLGRPHDAARAFDRAIGIRPGSATALWGGAVAHAEIGNKVVAQSYLKRTLALQPTWVDMARNIPQLAAFLQVSTRASDALHRVLGAFSTRTYRHAGDDKLSVEVGRIANQPAFGKWTFVTIGLSNRDWSPASSKSAPSNGAGAPGAHRPRIELVMATTVDGDVCGQVLANLAFHLGATSFFPEPGVMVRDVVGSLAEGDLSARLPHVYITVPRVWKLELPLDLGPPPITLAQVVPVSESEYALWRADVAGFDGALAKKRIDLADLRRPG